MRLRSARSFLVGLLLVIVSGASGYQLGFRKAWGGDILSDSGYSSDKIDTTLMRQVWNQLEKSYLHPEKIDSKEMLYGAVEGMTQSLDDPYTSFLPPVENQRSKEDLSGEFSGIGVQLGYKDKTLAVMSPLSENPAIKKGIRAGDLILKIKDEDKGVDKDTAGMSITEAVDLIRGEKGKSVTLTIFREGFKEPEEFTIVRDVINVPSVELTFVGDNVAHLKVTKFGEKTLPEWEASVTQIVKKKPSGIVLDLRNNPGGYLRRAIDLAGEFINSGVVVQQKGREKTEIFNVTRNGKLLSVPVVVLVNGGSASASEILAGALRERLNIKLIGEKTFGKGTVQEVVELPNGAGLHVTTAEWLLPSGKNIHGDGLEPDVVIEDDFETDEDEQLSKAIEELRSINLGMK